FPGAMGGVGLSCGPYGFTPGAAPRGPASDPGSTGPRPSAPGASPPRPGADVVLAGGVCPGVYPHGAEPGTRGSPAAPGRNPRLWAGRSEEHTSELQSLTNLVCRLLLEKKNKYKPAQ